MYSHGDESATRPLKEQTTVRMPKSKPQHLNCPHNPSDQFDLSNASVKKKKKVYLRNVRSLSVLYWVTVLC